jgi:signal transduction histidine kinase
MKFRYVLLLLVLLVRNNIYAQSDAVRLFASLNNTKDPVARIEAYKNIITWYSVSKPDSANYYANIAIKYAQDNNYPLGDALINSHVGQIDREHGRIELSKRRITYALGIYTQLHNAKGIANSFGSLGAIYGEAGDFAKATRYFVDAVKIQDSLKDYQGLMINAANLGSIYMEHDDLANSEKYFHMAEGASKRIPIIDQTISLYNSLGIMQIAKGDTQGGLNIFLHDLEVSDKPAFVNAHVECLLYLGNFYDDKGMPEQSLQYLKQGLALAQAQNLPEIEDNILVEIAHQIKKNDPGAAINYLQQAMAMCDSTDNKVFLLQVLGDLADVYKQQGKYQEALDILDKRQKLAGQVFDIQKTKEIENINSAYDFDTNQRIRQLEELNKRNEHQRNLIIAIAAFIVVFLIIMIFMYRKTHTLYRQLVVRERELKELNATKDKLFSVIGHDLRGPIARIPAILDIYEDEVTSADEKKFLFENLREHTKASLETFDKLLYWGQLLVKGIRLHQVKIRPKGYIKEAIGLKKIKAAEKNISVTDTTPDDIHVFADYAHFDFIIRNLLANALKYTNKNGHVAISADTRTQPGYTIFAIQDDGIGISKEVLPRIFSVVASKEGTAHEKGNGIGLMLCREFAQKNGGDLWVNSEEGKGTTFFFSVKNAS